MLDLSIIIVNYNTKKLLVDCINSITKDTGELKYEIIVVDNASTDGSIEAIKMLKVKVIANKENLGFSKANNQGIEISRGKYILLLNSDTLATKDSITKLVEFASNKSEAGVVGARLLNPDKTIQPSCFNFPNLTNTFKEYFLNRRGTLDKFYPKENSPSVVDVVVGAAFLITPQAREMVGLLDERYFMYFEDIAYCRRVFNAGLKVYYLPEAKIVHIHGASGKSNPEQTTRLIASSKIYHGIVGYYLIVFVTKLGQKLRSVLP